ncbi:MAG: hypothetical protein ACRDHE_15205, partial [Ktedonobacterales bacterium]
YGVDPDSVGQRPFAFYGSVALVCVPPIASLAASHLAHRAGRAERIGVLAVLLATLAAQVEIRLPS